MTMNHSIQTQIRRNQKKEGVEADQKIINKLIQIWQNRRQI